ncbi:MAG: DUF2141 domain-containing protein [Rhodospirillales bacterium]|nr:DUF2141 domain-containing protein [Rhodospirillales bacterium]
MVGVILGMSGKTFIASAVMAAALFLAGNAAAADLTIAVTALRSTDGMVRVALYGSREGFPDNDHILEDRVVPASDPVARFAGIAPGTYAIAVYHDENANDEFDQGFLGIPREGYAFSMGARAFFGPPDFDDAAFVVGAGGTDVTIPMTYW